MRQFLVLAVVVVAAFSWPLKKKDSEKRYEHWIGAWNVGEDDVKTAPAEDTEHYKNMLLRDVDNLDKAISALLGGDLTAVQPVFENLGFLMYLAAHDAQNGDKDIAAEQVPDLGCVAKSSDIENCDHKFGSILMCVQQSVREVKRILTSDMDTVEKVAKMKGICNALGRESKKIFEIAEKCYGDDKDEDENHWVAAWTATEEEIQNLPDSELGRFKKEMAFDLKNLIAAVNHILTTGGSQESHEAVGAFIYGAVYITKLDAENNEPSVPAADLPDGYNKGCTREDFENAGSCSLTFMNILFCIRGMSEDLLRRMDTMKPTEFVGFAKSAIALVADEAEYIEKKAGVCFPEKGVERRTFRLTSAASNQKKSSLSNVAKEELKRLLAEYLNRK